MLPPLGLNIYLRVPVTLIFNSLTPKLIVLCIAQRTTCAKWHQNRFIRFQNIVFTSLVTDELTDGRTDGRTTDGRTTDGQTNWTAGLEHYASLPWRRYKNVTGIDMLTDKIVGFFVTIRIVVQLNLFLDRLHGSPIGFSILGIFVIEKNTLPTVCIQRGRCVYSVSQKNLPPPEVF